MAELLGLLALPFVVMLFITACFVIMYAFILACIIAGGIIGGAGALARADPVSFAVAMGATAYLVWRLT